MQDIENFEHVDKTATFPVDPGKVSSWNRAAYAAGLAQAAFRGTYAPPNRTNWRDRTPAEIAVIRASMWPGTAK